MNRKLNLLIVAICFLLISGCVLTKNDDVPQKQIEADIERQPLKIKRSNGIVDWDFNPKSYKPLSCFAVNKDESKISSSNAELSVTVASWQKSTIQDRSFYNTLYGKMLMRYKKDGDKWVLENAEQKEFTWESPDYPEDYDKFVQKAMPLCAKSN